MTWPCRQLSNLLAFTLFYVWNHTNRQFAFFYFRLYKIVPKSFIIFGKNSFIIWYMLMHAEPISIDLLISKSKLLFYSKLNENVSNPWYEKIYVHNTSVLILRQISLWLSFITQLPKYTSLMNCFNLSVVSWIYRKIESGLPFTRCTILIPSKSFNSPISSLKNEN